MLINLISILLMAVFIYALVVNFRRGNYAYSFVMYVGAVIFYANFYHRLAHGWAFWVMLLMILLSASWRFCLSAGQSSARITATIIGVPSPSVP